MLVAVVQTMRKLLNSGGLVASRRVSRNQRELHNRSLYGIGKATAETTLGLTTMNRKLVKDALLGAVCGFAGTFVFGMVRGWISRLRTDRARQTEGANR